MPGLPQTDKIDIQFSCSNGSVSTNGFWSKHRGDISYNQLHKFWSELSPLTRLELLKIDKQTLFEQARKNMYCSRCNGLLLEGFLQIVLYGKSLQQEGTGGLLLPCNRVGASKDHSDDDLCMTTGSEDDVQDPSVHPWGGLTTTRDGMLTLMDCYMYSESLKGLQNVFDSARARERERELLYPDACGGGGRGWISHGMAGYGRGHGTRETCALHTARLSVDTLVDFWSALGEETRQSLLRMKEEDFLERLMYRFDSKRFCRDCRRNVIREFKELKELKRIRREPLCTSWFCGPDTGFQYEVSHDTVQADWHQTFVDTFGTYHHFEWAVGTGEGKSDILGFENVGLSARVQVNGLDLSDVNACYITLRAWKMDGRCTELSVKAHALNGKQCVHCRLAVGDGFVTISGGETIRRFFEHAEEAEEEEDDDSMDKDGTELDGECSRPQKHAKSPELAREFLLDAATVIFKEQVEKAFREGTARQNAHSIFVYLALKLLEERVHVACKEIITLEKQKKLLEEEEKEKQEEEERKERRRTKEREKKIRRKERLKEKERKCCQSVQHHFVPDVQEESTPSVDEEPNLIVNTDLSRPVSPDNQGEQFLNGYNSPDAQNHSDDSPYGDFTSTKDDNGSFETDHLKYSRRKLKSRKEFLFGPTLKWSDRRQLAVVSEHGVTFSKSEPRYQGDYFEDSSRSVVNGLNKHIRTNGTKSNTRIGGAKFGERVHCSNNRMRDRTDFNSCNFYLHREKVGREGKYAIQSESAVDMSKPYYRSNKYNQVGPKNRFATRNNLSTRDLPHIKKVWEPMESQKYPRSNSDPDVKSSSFKVEPNEPDKNEPSNAISSNELTGNTVEIKNEDEGDLKESRNFGTSNSDACSSCLSEGDSHTSSSSNPQTTESSSTSDSEDISQNSEERESSPTKTAQNGNLPPKTSQIENLPTKAAEKYENGKPNVSMVSQLQAMVPPFHTQGIHFPMFQAPPVGYYHQSPFSWPANGFMPLAQPNHYILANPFGYGLNGNSGLIQYGAPQHPAPPLLNPSQLPVYCPVAQTNSGGLKEAHPEANTGPMGPGPLQAPQNGVAEQNEPTGNTGFSLFHFGGPVAVSNEYQSNPVPLKEGISSEHVEACDKKDAIEEYNLFAASNGMRFSFF